MLICNPLPELQYSTMNGRELEEANTSGLASEFHAISMRLYLLMRLSEDSNTYERPQTLLEEQHQLQEENHWKLLIMKMLKRQFCFFLLQQ